MLRVRRGLVLRLEPLCDLLRAGHPAPSIRKCALAYDDDERDRYHGLRPHRHRAVPHETIQHRRACCSVHRRCVLIGRHGSHTIHRRRRRSDSTDRRRNMQGLFVLGNRRMGRAIRSPRLPRNHHLHAPVLSPGSAHVPPPHAQPSTCARSVRQPCSCAFDDLARTRGQGILQACRTRKIHRPTRFVRRAHLAHHSHFLPVSG